jgi:hypothetical protein
MQKSAAAIYSLIGTAKLNGIDPESYLRNVLSRIADHPSIASKNCSRGISLQILRKARVTLLNRYCCSTRSPDDYG